MQVIDKLSTPKSYKIITFIYYLGGGLLIFLFGSNTFSLFPTNKNALYEWGLTGFFLLRADLLQRIQRVRIMEKAASALFIAAAANAVNLSLGNFLGPILNATGSDMRSLAVDKLSQAIPIVVTIILLTLWTGDDLGSLFLKRGDLRQGLKFGIISFGIFALIFIGVVV